MILALWNCGIRWPSSWRAWRGLILNIRLKKLKLAAARCLKKADRLMTRAEVIEAKIKTMEKIND